MTQEEFLVLAKRNLGIDAKGVEKVFKKSKVGDKMDLPAFLKWCDKAFGSADDATFASALTMESGG